MTLSEKDKKLLIFVGILGIICATYFLVYSPLDKKQEAIKNEIKKLQADYDVLIKKQTEKDKYEGELKAVRYQIKQNEALLPPDLRQEYIIHILKSMEKDTGMRFGDLTFTEEASVAQQGAAPKAQAPQGTAKQNDAAAQTQGQQPAPSQQQASKQIQDGTGIKMEVKTSYTGSYSGLKKFLSLIQGFENKVTITDISFKSAENSSVTGSLGLTFYGIKDSKRPMPEWKNKVDSGRENIFMPFDGYTASQTKTAAGTTTATAVPADAGTEAAKKVNYDFILTANPYSADVPSVILSYMKDKSRRGYVYVDSREFEQTELEILKENDTYYYSIKAGRSEFPGKNEKDKAILAVENGEINFHIVSKRRNSEKDKNGVNLALINKTDLNLNVKTDFEDPVNPRVKIVKQEGKVTVVK